MDSPDAITTRTPLTEGRYPDAELLALGVEFERLWTAELAAKPVGDQYDSDWSEWDRAYERTQKVARRIQKLPARTHEGMRVKARGILWCHSRNFEGFEAEATDLRLAEQIVRDLLAMGGAS